MDKSVSLFRNFGRCGNYAAETARWPQPGLYSTFYTFNISKSCAKVLNACQPMRVIAR
jgi:hypothetical protein